MCDRSFSLEDWRSGLAGRRELGRRAILEAIGSNGNIEPVIARMKQDIGFERLGAKDKNVFNVMASNLRRVTQGWGRIDADVRHAFSVGVTPYSALCKIVSLPNFYS